MKFMPVTCTWTCYVSSGRWSGPHAARPSATRCSAGTMLVLLDQLEDLGEHGRGVDALLACIAPWETEGARVLPGEIELPKTGATIPWDAVVAATGEASRYTHAHDAAPDVARLLPRAVYERSIR